MSKISYAQSYLGEGWDQYLKGNLQTFIDVDKSGEDLAIDFIKNIVLITRYLLGSLALIMGLIYGMAIIFSRGKDESIEKQKNNFMYVFIGFIIVFISENLANIFNAEQSNTVDVINFAAANDQLRDGANYIKWLLSSVIILFMTISGLRIITAGGEEEVLTKQKKSLTWGFIGMLAVLLADNIVNAIYVVNSPSEIIAGTPQNTITELGSIAQLILVFLGPIAIIFTIYSGFMYLTAMDNEERSQKAKKMIVGGVTGIIMIYSAFAIVNTITSEKLSFITNIIA